jgi:predicted secreted protein with PEFG-CTERM motif
LKNGFLIITIILSSSLFLVMHDAHAATVPDPPTGFNAIPIAPTTVNLSWNPPQHNGSSAITGYKIEYKTPTTTYSSWPSITPGNVTKYNVTSLNTGTTYIFRVSAINAIGTGNPSPESVATPTSTSAPPKNIPPNPPTGLVATASSGTQVNLAWNSPTSNGGYPVTGYKIQYSIDSGSFTILVQNTGTTATAYSHTGLSSGHTYNYQVFAINSVGTSNGSNTASAVPTQVSTAPYPPAGLTANPASPTSISLSWTTPSSDGGSPITGYKIEAKIGSGAYTVIVANTGTTSTSYVNTGLITGTTYTYRVSAINSIGTSGPSNEASATPAQTLTPTGVTAVAVSPTEIDLSWIAPSQTYGQPIGGYRIDQKFSSGTFDSIVENTGQTTSYQIKNLVTGKTYTFVVIALYTGGGESNPSSEVSATPTSTSAPPSGTTSGTGTTTTTPSPALPDPPTGLNVTKASPTSVQISWVSPSNNGKPSVTGYKIEYKIGTGIWNTLISNTGVTNSYLHTGLAVGTYTYRVSSINSVGTGNPSAEASITLVQNTPPPPPIQSSGGLMSITGTSYSVNYNIIGGKVTGISVDPSTFSLQVQMQSSSDGTLSLNLPRELIDAKKSDGTDDLYLVTADKQILKFTETKTIDMRALTIDIPAGTSQISIYGTHVVPEFPTSVLVLVIALTSVIIFSRKVIR